MSFVNSRSIKFVIHWPRFGPYHVARIHAAQNYLSSQNIELAGLEVASSDRTYQWSSFDQQLVTNRKIVFPNRVYDEISSIQIFHGLFTALREIQPDVIAVNGYSSIDSWAIIVWSKLHHRRIILMNDSKEDDLKRSPKKEYLKKLFVRNFDAGLCAGTEHQRYLSQLGMNIKYIFTGYDVVDNAYFWHEAENVRKNIEGYRNLPGLNSLTPFFLASSRFIKRKNLGGLLDAYHLYRECFVQENRESLPWRLVILGDGDERYRLECKIADQSIEDVTLVGFRQIEELPAYYGLASVFIHPALNDQWGLVVNEAMACGLPVLVSKHCGCVPELVHIGENGYLFDPEDTVELANLMLSMSTGRVDIAKMGRASLETISNWGLERFSQGLFGAIQAALGRADR
jgi:1,2-diacylglycerol 3-alpha-glucosyltransferase